MNREMFRIMIQVSGAFLAIYGFAVLLDTPKKYLFHAGVSVRQEDWCI